MAIAFYRALRLRGGRTTGVRAAVDFRAERVSIFAKLYPHDVRPLQPLNGRVVKESQ
jgi:hypothetical protein